jgi:hypothetical protein
MQLLRTYPGRVFELFLYNSWMDPLDSLIKSESSTGAGNKIE